MRKRTGLLVAFAALAAAAGQNGLKPRAAVAEYSMQAETPKAAIGAAVLNQDQVQGAFSTDLNRGYVVVEVGVFPKSGAQVDLGPGDFMLRVNGGDPVRPAGPKAIASVLQRNNSGDREITLHPTVGVGYESGPSYDPVYGDRRGGGWNTGVGVGVGVGGTQPPASTDKDRKTMEQELSEQQLPEKVINAPAAGYLYFPVKRDKRDRKRVATYELEYNSPDGKVVLKATEAQRP